jgi:hypothetical protein
MKKLTIESFVFISIILICVIAFFSKDLTISFNKNLFETQNITEKEISERFEKLENVT